MSSRRSMRGLRREQRSQFAPMRLVIEPLEARRLLAGINLSVYVDQDDLHRLDATSDQPAPDRLVYVDLKSHGLGDTCQPQDVTEQDGSAFFAELGPADYSSGVLNTPPVQPRLGSLDPTHLTPTAAGRASLEAVGDDTPRTESSRSISTGSYSLAENTQHRVRLGLISIVGVDEDLSFQILPSDPRFEVYDGSLYFLGGQVDYETEPTINFTVTASDYYSDLTVTKSVTVSVIDVNERPVSLQLSGGQVPENEPGAIVGNLKIVDPDVMSDYAFYVFDSRFTVMGTTLKLAAGVALDYETEPMVHLNVAATDGTHEIFTVVAIKVLDRDEDPVVNSSLQLDGNQLQEFVPGAIVGLVSVSNPRDSSYAFSVSDGRFEIVGEVLKLRADQRVSLSVDAPLSLTITAMGIAGDRVSESFPINISANQSPYHNLSIAEDVNGDGFVSPIDVLIIVNSLNIRGTHPVPTGGTAGGEPPSEMPDVNDDGIISPLDALIIINHINRNFTHGSLQPASDVEGLQAEGESYSLIPTVEASMMAPESDSERRRRENSSIDAELELLLDQLAQSNRSIA